MRIERRLRPFWSRRARVLGGRVVEQRARKSEAVTGLRGRSPCRTERQGRCGSGRGASLRIRSSYPSGPPIVEHIRVDNRCQFDTDVRQRHSDLRAKWGAVSPPRRSPMSSSPTPWRGLHTASTVSRTVPVFPRHSRFLGLYLFGLLCHEPQLKTLLNTTSPWTIWHLTPHTNPAR